MKRYALMLAVVLLIGDISHLPAQSVSHAITQDVTNIPREPDSPATRATASPLVPVPNDTVHEFAYRQVELETQRLDKLIQSTETVGTLLASLVVAFAAILSFFGLRSIKDFKDELRASVETLVDKALSDKAKKGESFEKLVAQLNTAQSRWAEIEKSIDNLAKFEAVSSAQYGDAQGAYNLAKAISEKDVVNSDERRLALGYLLKIVELGEQGKVDPNLLYNACSVASEMDFDHEALKLATLCAHWDPKPSHVLRKSRLEDIFGMRFELKAKSLSLADQHPKAVRDEAWNAARELVKQGPTFQCELIYADFHNIAERNRESGYIDDAINVMEDLTQGKSRPSYAYAILSGFYAMRGNATWRTDYISAIARAVEILRAESPACTWYAHTLRDILQVAKHARMTAEIMKILNDSGIVAANKGLEGTGDPPTARQPPQP